MRKPAGVSKMEATKVAKDGAGVTVKVRVLNYCDNKYKNWAPHCSDVSKDMVVILENVKQLVDDGKTVRTNTETGRKEVLARIQVDKANSPLDYWRRHIDAFKRGEYTGPVDDMDKYWDSDTGDFAKQCWIPLEDAHGNPALLKLSNWVTNFPKEGLVQGVPLDVISCTFGVFLRLAKAKGAAKAIENAVKNAGGGGAAPVAPAEAAGEVASAAPTESKRVPEVFFNMNTNVGVTIRGNEWVEGTSALASFRQLVGGKRYFVTIPSTNAESFAFVQPLEGYQADNTEYEPGPSVIIQPEYSFDAKHYVSETPATQQTPATRKPILHLSYMVCQYQGKEPEYLTNPNEYPWTVTGMLSGPQIGLTGITRIDDWSKFGSTEWRGVAVFGINASDTRRALLNQPGQAAAKKWGGLVSTYIKGFFPDLRATLAHAGLPVDATILKTLYSDVYQRLTSENDEGQKVEVISLHFDKFKARNRGASPLTMPNLLHLMGNDEIINLNECEKNVGHLLDTAQLYVLPYIPVPNDVTQRIEETDQTAVRDYRREVISHLRSLGTGDKLIEVLLGFKDAPPMKNGGRTNILYHSEEIAAISGLQHALQTKDKKKLGEILPTVLVGRNLPRDNAVWSKYGLKSNPTTLGFDFQLYMVQKQVHADERVPARK